MTSEPDMENLLASIRKAIDSDIGQNTRVQAVSGGFQEPYKGSMRELHAKFENNLARGTNSAEEILELRTRINRNRKVDEIVEPMRFGGASSTPPSRNGFAAILAGDMAARGTSAGRVPISEPPRLRPSLLEREAPVQHYQAPAYEAPPYQSPQEEPEAYQTDAAWGEEEQSYLPAVQEQYEEYAPQPLMADNTASAANESFNQLADTLMARAMGERSIEDMTQDLLRGMLRNWLDAHLPSLVERLVREEIERVARRGR